MDYRCPNCGEDLQYKLTPTKPTGDRAILGFNIYRTPSCKKCGALLEITHGKEDYKLIRIIFIPLLFCFFSMLFNQTWLLYICGIAFIAGIIYVAIYIRKPGYRNRTYFNIYEKKP